jgi:hypothetical protein
MGVVDIDHAPFVLSVDAPVTSTTPVTVISRNPVKRGSAGKRVSHRVLSVPVSFITQWMGGVQKQPLTLQLDAVSLKCG